MDKKSFLTLGLMSGTSLDGLDLALCRFEKDENWKFKIIRARTEPYSEKWKEKLENAAKLNAIQFILLHKEYGKYLASCVRDFISTEKEKPELIASHGHTIFHQPGNGLTFQIGDGTLIAAETGITTVSDFRSLDVALGGQGAPLVPIGDELLFGNYDFCLNLGGFSNISFQKNNKRIALDICPVNTVLNYIAQMAGQEYDKDGLTGRCGCVFDPLLKELNAL
jgi:anhydro-N-acetylmuramic acid kinase